MTAAASAAPLFRPPAPIPHERPQGSLATILALRRNPLEIWTRAHFEAPVLIGRSILGLRAIVSDPQGVRRIFLDNAANYKKDDLQLRVLSPGLGSGLLTVEGEAWKTQRRALAPLFSPRQVADFAPAMRRVSLAAVSRLAAMREGRAIDVSQAMARITLEMLEQTLFSTGLGRDPSEFQTAVTRYFDTFGRIDPLDVIGAPAFLPRLGRLRGRATLAFFDTAVAAIVKSRRDLIAMGAKAPSDLLTLLLRAQDPETGQGIGEADVRANIVTFIGAGHETTSNALTWTLYLLSQDVAWRARVEAELDSAGADAEAERLPALRAALEEALRLYPPAAILSREAIGEDVVAGVRIPAGTVVTVSPYVLHRHKTLWRDPSAFMPARFMPGEREAIDRYAYIPFGAGPRVCIGMSFAMQEAMILLSDLLRNFRFDLAPGHRVEPAQRVTLRPRFGMLMTMRRRV